VAISAALPLKVVCCQL